MSDSIGIALIAFIVFFLGGLFTAIMVANVKYWLDQKAEAKKITILPDGKGGYVHLPPGVKYIPLHKKAE